MDLFRRADATIVPLPPPPVVLSPSGTFDGDDGKWSTFTINVAGDGQGQGQNFKVLIFTSSPITMVPARTEWCSDDECAKRRGIMDVGSRGLDTSSAAYSGAGSYTLPLQQTYGWSQGLLLPNLNGTLDANWGLTTVGLGTASKQSVTIAKQYVASYFVKDLFLGSLGLSAGAISPTGATVSTFLSGLAAVNTTLPSSSYGFTAGAYYRNDGKGILGNMVFGGYDRSRLSNEGVSIPMANKRNNTLLVGINSITYTPDPAVQQGTTSLIAKVPGGGFFAAIDSTLPYLVLPDDICDNFVKMFHLGYDKTTSLYTINSTAHAQNQQQNATVSFKISAQPQDSASFANIVFPYDAFFLEANNPIYSNTTNYFPIRKSDNGRYILGRTFLQEAYIVVDYERANFTVAPALFSSPMPRENLVTIFKTDYVPPKSAPKSGSSGLDGGSIAGIVIGIVAAFLLLGAGAFLYLKKHRKSKAIAMDQEWKPSGIDTIAAGGEIKDRRASELTGSEVGSPQYKAAGYYGAGDHKSIPELPDSPPVELCSAPLDGSDRPDYFASGPKPRRRGATRDSSGAGTPRTPVAELPVDEGITPMHRPTHNRGPSDNSLSTNIDEVLAGTENDSQQVQRKHSSKFVEHTGEGDAPSRAEMVVSPLENTRSDEAGIAAELPAERRPSHTRGLSDTTIQSDSTAVSQPTSDELERWARSSGQASKRS